MAKRKKSRKKAKKNIPLLTVAGLVPGLAFTYTGYEQGGPSGAMTHLTHAYTGFNLNTNKFEREGLNRGTFPLIVGVAGSAIASKLGLNKYMRAIPFIKF